MEPPDNTTRAPRQSSALPRPMPSSGCTPRSPQPCWDPPRTRPHSWASPSLLQHLPGQSPVWCLGFVLVPLSGTGTGSGAWCRAQRCQAPPNCPPHPRSPSAHLHGCPLPPAPSRVHPSVLGTPTPGTPRPSRAQLGGSPGALGCSGAVRGCTPWDCGDRSSTARTGMSVGREHPAHPRTPPHTPGLPAGQRARSCGAPLGARARVPALEGQVPGSAAAGRAAVRGAAVRGEPGLLRGWRHVSISHGRVNGSPHTSQRRQGQLRTGGVRSDTSANGPGIPRLLSPARSGASLGELGPSRWAQGHCQMRPVEQPPTMARHNTTPEVLGGPEMGLETWGSPLYTPALGSPQSFRGFPATAPWSLPTDVPQPRVMGWLCPAAQGRTDGHGAPQDPCTWIPAAHTSPGTQRPSPAQPLLLQSLVLMGWVAGGAGWGVPQPLTPHSSAVSGSSQAHPPVPATASLLPCCTPAHSTAGLELTAPPDTEPPQARWHGMGQWYGHGWQSCTGWDRHQNPH